MPQSLLTCCLVDVQTVLSLSALYVPGKTLDDIEWAGIQARDSQVGVGGVLLDVRAWSQLVNGDGVLHSVCNGAPGQSDAVVAGGGGSQELKGRQNCGGKENFI